MRALALAFALLATPALAQTAAPGADPAPGSPPPAPAAAPTTDTSATPVPVPLRYDSAASPRRGCSSMVTPTS